MKTEDPADPIDPSSQPAGAAETGILPLLRAAAYRLAKLIALGTGVFVCVLLLGTVSLTTTRAGRIQLEKPEVERNWIQVSGRAWPGDAIEILSGERNLGFTIADWQGRFDTSLPLPPEAQAIWARVFSRDNPDSPIARADFVPLSRDPASRVPPRIALVYYIEETRKLWIAGYGNPAELLQVRNEAGQEIASLTVDAHGCFDALVAIPPASEPPARVVLERQSGPPEPFAVARVVAEDLPLSRTAAVEIRPGEPQLVLRVSLPSTHPYFRLLEKGLLSAAEFGRAGFGSFVLAEDLQLVSLRKNADQGIVELKQTWPSLPPMLVWTGSKALAGSPFLTSQDRLTVRFQGIRPAWFGDPAPSLMVDDQAIWHGPLQAKDLEIGFRITDLLRIYRSRPEAQTGAPQGEEKFRDFIRKLDEQRGAAFRSVWNQLVLLIPFAGLIWLGSKRSFGSAQIWRALTATALVMAVWRIFGSLAPILRRLGGYLLAIPRVSEPEAAMALGELLPQAYWVTFAFLAAALPRVWRRLMAAEPLAIPVSSPPGRLRRLGSGLRWTYAVAASVLYLAVLLRLFRPAEMLDAAASFQFVLERLSLPLCLCLVLLAFGLRALLAGVGMALFVLWQAVREEAGNSFHRVSDLDAVASLPQWMIVLLVVLATCPFLYFLVRGLAGPLAGRRWAISSTAVLAASAWLLPRLPVRATLVLAGSLLLFGFGDVLLKLLRSSHPASAWARTMESRPRLTRAALYLLALLLAWPLTGPATKLESGQLQLLNLQIQDLFVYGLALGSILLLRDHARTSPSPVVDRATLSTGVYLFAVLLINSYSTWLLVPVPFLVGLLLAGFWLFRPEPEVQRLRAIPANKLSRQRQLIQDVVDSGVAGEQFSTIQKSLAAKLNSAELAPEDYEDKLKAYRSYLEKELELETVASGVRSREAVFGVGGPQLWSNVSSAVKAGAFLAAGPFLIALYQFLPHSRVSYPYPLMTLLSFIVSAAAIWLLSAFFFGFYYAYLRGTSGLSKGLHLFVGLCLPFAVYRLLNVQSFVDMRSFLLWATQLFLFCSLLGLIAVDYRLLRSNGFRLKDLTSVHNVPALSAYASTAVAALVPTVIALITGKFGDMVKFFLETVLGIPSR